MSIFFDKYDECSDRQELFDARRNIKDDLKAGRISKARYAKEMQICNDHEAHLDALDCAYSDDY